MNEFPRLKTGAVMQFPAQKAMRHATQVLRFVDGSEQRFRESKGNQRRWIVRLDLLDDTELRRIEEFFTSQQGRLGSFQFTDPWDGATHEDCSIEADELAVEHTASGRGRTLLTIVENRN